MRIFVSRLCFIRSRNHTVVDVKKVFKGDRWNFIVKFRVIIAIFY